LTKTPISRIIYHARRTEFARYFWAGSLTFLTDFLVFLLLTEGAGVNYLWSNLVAVSVGMMMSYLLCVRWVFRERRYSQVAFEFSLFVLASVGCLFLNEALLWVLVEWYATHHLVAKVMVTAAIFVVNFAIKKIVLFRR
jgi:putative flippase GtrA